MGEMGLELLVCDGGSGAEVIEVRWLWLPSTVGDSSDKAVGPGCGGAESNVVRLAWPDVAVVGIFLRVVRGLLGGCCELRSGRTKNRLLVCGCC